MKITRNGDPKPSPRTERTRAEDKQDPGPAAEGTGADLVPVGDVKGEYRLAFEARCKQLHEHLYEMAGDDVAAVVLKHKNHLDFVYLAPSDKYSALELCGMTALLANDAVAQTNKPPMPPEIKDLLDRLAGVGGIKRD